MTRFLHTGDWQLGMTRHFLDEGAQARFSQARIDVVRRIGELAREEGAEFVVVAGDVFETNHVDRQTVARAAEALKSFGVPVLLLPGNHDPLDASSVLRRTEWPEGIRVIEDPAPIEVVPGVEVVGVPWRTKRAEGDPVAEALSGLDPAGGRSRILLAHGATASYGDEDAPGRIDIDVLDAALESGTVRYVALGDHHNLAAPRDRVRYAGAPEPTSYREKEPGHVLVVDLDEKTCAATPHRVGRWRFVSRPVELDSDEALDALEESLDAESDKARVVLRLAPRGTLSLTQHARWESVLSHARDVFAAVEIWERHADLVVLPADEDFEDLDVGGFARTALDRLRARADGPGEDGETARRALALMMRLAGGGA